MHGLPQELPEEHLSLFILSFQNFLRWHLSVPCAIICKVSGMSPKLCLLSTASNMLDDTLAVRKCLCCLLRGSVEAVVSILFW